MGLEERFRDSEGRDLLEPYVDGEGLIAGYRVEGLLSLDPRRHVTYEASMPDGRRVALKLLNVPSDGGRRGTKRFERRLRLRASIEHPHLLPIFDWGRVGDRYYLAMAFSRAPTLDDLLAAAPLKTTGALRMLGQLADGLEAAHRRGLVHRDLAPDRVLVEPRGGGHVLLGDFAVADPDWDDALLDVAGSVPYLPPEKVRDEPLTPESNVYSLACILVACLTGSPPYTSERALHPQGGTAGAVAYAHVAEPPPRLSERHAKLPPSIDGVVAVALAKDPAERLMSPRQLVTAAAATLGTQIPGPPPDGASPTLPRDRGSSKAGTARDEAAGRHVPPPLHPDTKRASVPLSPPVGLVPALRRYRILLAIAATVACAGALGFLLGRSGDDTAERPPASARAADRERTATALALERLDARRVTSRRRLAEARTSRAQAAEARRLRAAYRSTGGMLPRGATRVRSALREAERAYRRLAVAARRVDRRRFAAARLAVRRGERRLDQAIAAFNRARRSGAPS